MTSSSARLQHIANNEHITVSPPVLSALISTSNGDLRRAITYLQSAARLSAASIPPEPITARDVQEIAGVVPDSIVHDFARALGIEVRPGPDGDAMDVDTDGAALAKPNRKTETLRGFDLIREKVRMLMREGYSASQILSQVRPRPSSIAFRF